MKKECFLICGSITSVIVLIVLGILQTADAKFLKLPAQWLVIAIFPVLVALFAGGFITRFKGFGVELEAKLKMHVASVQLTALNAAAEIKGDEKQSESYLDELSVDRKLTTRRLLFQSGRRNYYNADAIVTYLRRLPNIQFFEIRSSSVQIVCLIPVSVFRSDMHKCNDNVDRNTIIRFVQAIEEDNVPSAFPDTAITLKVTSEQNLVDVLKAMRSERADFAAVVSSSGRYLGVVFANEVERRIADSVLSARTA